MVFTTIYPGLVHIFIVCVYLVLKSVTSVDLDEDGESALPHHYRRYPDPRAKGNESWTEDEVRLYLDDLQTNVTAVLDGLLDETRYNKRLRPGHSKGYPVTIDTNIYIKSMGPVSEADMELSMDCYFRQEWQDDRLIWNNTVLTNLQGEEINVLSLSVLTLNKMWRPDTFFFNGKRSYVHDITQPNKLLRIMKNGVILYSMRLTIKANCPMRLLKFPLDTQACPLEIGSFAYPVNDVMYKWVDGNYAVDKSENMELSQFELVDIVATNDTARHSAGEEYSKLTVVFILERRIGFFILQNYVPCIFTVILSWVSFFLSKKESAARVALGITAILTMTTLSFTGRGSVSKAATTTALDWFQIICFAFVFAALAEYTAVNFMDNYERGASERAEQRIKKPKKVSPKCATSLLVSTAVTNPGGHFAMVTSTCEDDEINYMETLSNLPHPGVSGIGVTSGVEYITDEEDECDDDNDEDNGETRCTCGRFLWRCKVRCERRPPRDQYGDTETRRGTWFWPNIDPQEESRLDNMSRIAFPLLFLVMNLFYWFGYIYFPDP